jgi:hypothetical protein
VAICAWRVGEGWLSVHGEMGGENARGQCASEPDFLSLSARNARIHHTLE